MDVPTLPNDLEALKRLLLQVITSQETQQQQLQERDAMIERQRKRIELLEAELRLQRQKRFGASSERHKDPFTPDLFGETLCPAHPLISDEDDVITIAAHQRQRRRRKKNGDLPVVEVVYDLADDEKVCSSCHGPLSPIKDKTLNQYAIIPAQYYIIRHVRKRYACPCKQCIKTAAMPKQILPKSEASPPLLAYLMVAKFLDGLPLYRLEKIAKREGMDLPRAKTSRWLIKASEHLQPMLNLIEDQFFSYDIGLADETGIQVLKEDDRNPENNSYLWMRRGGPPDRPVILVNYAPSRAGEIPLQLLDGFQGYLVTDAYAGYNPVIKKQDLVWVACNDHARRKFKEAFQVLEKTVKQGETAASIGLAYYKQLYRIEREAKDLNPEQRKLYRQANSIPVWEAFQAWLLSVNGTVYDEKTQNAITYTLNHFTALKRYCEDGRLPISNIQCEHVAKTIAIPRKNFLFCDTTQGAHASARIYSIIETARANGHHPLHYLTVLLAELPNISSLEGYQALLPWSITPEQVHEKMATYPTLQFIA